MEIPPKLQHQIAQLQQLQQQTQAVMNQKYQMEIRQNEVNSASEELQKASTGKTVYKSIGDLLIKVGDVSELSKELGEEKETLSIRIKALESQEKQLKERLKSLQEQVSTAMKLTGNDSAGNN